MTGVEGGNISSESSAIVFLKDAKVKLNGANKGNVVETVTFMMHFILLGICVSHSFTNDAKFVDYTSENCFFADLRQNLQGLSHFAKKSIFGSVFVIIKHH